MDLSEKTRSKTFAIRDSPGQPFPYLATKLVTEHRNWDNFKQVIKAIDNKQLTEKQIITMKLKETGHLSHSNHYLLPPEIEEARKKNLARLLTSYTRSNILDYANRLYTRVESVLEEDARATIQNIRGIGQPEDRFLEN